MDERFSATLQSQDGRPGGRWSSRRAHCLALPWLLAASLVMKASPLCAASASSWPMYQANASHTGYVPVELDPANFSLLWSRHVGSPAALNPVAAAAGKVFVSNLSYPRADPAFFALEATTGTELWKKDVGSVRSVNPPSYGDGKVYIQTESFGSDGYLRAYDAESGELIFRAPYHTQGERRLAPTLYAGDVYVNGGYNGGMYAFDGTDGGRWFNDTLPQISDSTPAVDGRYAYAFLGDSHPTLYVIDRVSGATAFWIDDLDVSASGIGQGSAPVLGSLNNVLAVAAGRLYSFDPAYHQIRYTISAGFTGQPAFAHGVVYCIQAGALSAREEAYGNSLWSWAPPEGETLTGTIVVTDTHLFTRTSTTTYAIDLSTHASVWSYPASGHLALGNDSLYIAGDAGTLTAIALAPVNHPPAPPILGSVNKSTVVEGRTLRLALKAWDPNGDALTYGVDPLPPGATIDSASGTFTWTPSHDQVGTWPVTFTVSDGVLTDSKTVTLTVTSIWESVQWPMHQVDASHTGYVAVGLDPSCFLRLWQKSLPGTYGLQPVTAAAGKVFASNAMYYGAGPALFVLDAATGDELWNKDFGSVHWVNPPSYGDGKVYIQTDNGSPDIYLRAYDAASGELVFRAPHTAQMAYYLAPTLYAGNVYVAGGYNGGMYGFNGTSGAQLWFSDVLPQYDQWTPAVDETRAYAYLGGYSPALYVLNRATGAVEFTIADLNVDGYVWSTGAAPVLGSSGNVLAVQDGRLISFDLANRKIGYEIARAFAGQASLAHGVIYCINAGALSARDEATGGPLWSWEAPGGGVLTGTIVVTNTHLFAGTSTITYALDLATHEMVWSYPAGGALTLGNSSLYLAGGNRLLTAIGVSPATSNPPPVALELSVLTAQGAPAPITLAATDLNGDALTFEVLTLPAHGSLSGEPPALIYAPDAGFFGADSFTYRANDGTTDSDSATVNITVAADTVPPTGTVSINGGAAATRSRAVMLSLSAADPGGSGVDAMRVVNSGETAGAWEPYRTDRAWTLTSGAGLKTVWVQFRDRAGHLSDAEPGKAGAQAYKIQIIFDPSAPTGSLLVNGGASSTNAQAVTLNLTAADTGGSGLDAMRFVNTGGTASDWEPFKTTKAWTLTSGAGTKTVWVQFRDKAGNISDADPVQAGFQSYKDDIVYDPFPPTGSISINGGDSSTTTLAVTLNLTAADTGGSGLEHMRFANSGGTASAWEPFKITKTWTLTSGAGTKTVWVQFRDKAGNLSDADPLKAGAQSYMDTIQYTGP